MATFVRIFSNCCFILSLWGVIMLAFLGIFFQIKSVALVEDVHNQNDYGKTSRNCFIAAGLYCITLILSWFQKWKNQRITSSKLSSFQMTQLE